ncbi:hypothetical protein [Xanthobacter versatilis]|uniref:hypothetical protein n=1 Tax=Xanthobacter autotrophicus (strain ATCC BAA-1158 / Py2) TaxID=78245 RepID=UPI003727D599
MSDKIIEPDPDGGYRKEPRVGLLALLVMALLWIGFLTTGSPDWTSVMAGLGTGAMLMAWGMEVTGNKTPDFMKPRKRAHQWPPRDWSQ